MNENYLGLKQAQILVHTATSQNIQQTAYELNSSSFRFHAFSPSHLKIQTKNLEENNFEFMLLHQHRIHHTKSKSPPKSNPPNTRSCTRIKETRRRRTTYRIGAPAQWLFGDNMYIPLLLCSSSIHSLFFSFCLDFCYVVS